MFEGGSVESLTVLRPRQGFQFGFEFTPDHVQRDVFAGRGFGAEIAAVLNVTAPLASPLIRKLVDRTFLERSDRKPDPRERAMSALDPWNPEAGFFHTATKTVKYVSVRESTRRTVQRARELPMPSPVKRYRGAATLDLPRPDASGEFARVALQRRTWRRFSKRPVTLQDLFAWSDFISLHLPLNVHTRDLLGPMAFSQMKDQVRIVSTGTSRR